MINLTLRGFANFHHNLNGSENDHSHDSSHTIYHEKVVVNVLNNFYDHKLTYSDCNQPVVNDVSEPLDEPVK